MKKYILVALAMGFLAACVDKKNSNIETNTTPNQSVTTNLTKPKTEIAPENLAEAEFKIEGMTCQMGCANTIQSKLEALTGVNKADVSFENANAIVYYDKTALTIDDLKNTINTIADGKLYKVVE